MTSPRALLALALLSSLLPIARADNWPAFRGPTGNGTSTERNLPTVWADGKNILWKTPLPGPGSSSPITWGDKVLVTCYSGYGASRDEEGDPARLQRHLVCINRKDGAILWKQAVPSAATEDRYSGYITEHGYASHTPATDGKTVFAFFGKTGVVAFELATGKKLWQTSVGESSGNRRWGSAASPVLYKEMVIVNAADESRAVVALEKSTGKVVWKAPGDSSELCYATPVLAGMDGAAAELLLAVPGELWAMNPDTGKLRWFAQIPITGNISPSVVVDKDRVYAFGGFPRLAAVAVRRGGKGDVGQSHIAWSIQTGPYVPTPVLHEGHLYWVSENAMAYCVEAATGKVAAREQLPVRGRGKLCYASTLLAGGKLYAVTRTGGTFILEAAPTLKQLAQNRIESDPSDFNASPALSDGQIFLRSNKFLYCISGK